MTDQTNFFYASVGARLTLHHLDVEHASLTRDSSVELPAPVQYVWPHPTLSRLYVASSDGMPGNVAASAPAQAGSNHFVTVLNVEASTGALTPVGPPVSLPSRPIHCCVGPDGRYLFVAYNRPSGLTVHPIDADGSVGRAVEQKKSLDFGVYGHQVRTFSRGRTVVLVSRGNDAVDGQPEDPGALKVFQLTDGQLVSLASITPGECGGYGFGPRHLDIHPNGRWVYVSIERQNELQLFDVDAEGALSAHPRQVIGSLSVAGLDPVRQMASAVHVHPSGKFVYQVNRSDGRRRIRGWSIGGQGEDSLAVYAIDRKGCLEVIQHVEMPAVHVRTFSIDPTGRILVAASIEPVSVMTESYGVSVLPASIVVYRIADDGRLEFARAYEVDTRGSLMFWTGIVRVTS